MQEGNTSDKNRSRIYPHKNLTEMICVTHVKI